MSQKNTSKKYGSYPENTSKNQLSNWDILKLVWKWSKFVVIKPVIWNW